MDSKFDESKVYKVSFAQFMPDGGQCFVALGNSCQDIMNSASD